MAIVSPDTERTGLVTGTASRVLTWCKGAAPGPGEEHQVIPGVALDVYEGDEVLPKPPAATLPPGRDGAFSVRLTSGTWCLVRAGRWKQLEARAPPGADDLCWRRLVTRCDAVVKVEAGGTQRVDVRISERCPWNQPCFPPGLAPP
ncbi:MAG: hypothetical protein AB1938_00965 [Myxococcota bacterium]